ncbi:hypothetical protein CMU89_17120 [Elizabethkingia anophelis]|nr:hypothetical protein [Elizabethkingia anophelis]MDV3544363.1 hypothetical protein [Elizabethkingia anophelis]MDV3952168.1 hypothetical protein [Elizabethkingia anophelis]
MKVKIGAYPIETTIQFTSLGEAVDYVKGIFPELDENLIKEKVKPFIQKSNVNQSNNSTSENTGSDKRDSKNSKGDSNKQSSGKG